MIRDAYLETAGEARALIASRDVERRWDEPSALRDMTVGGLAAHLARSVTIVDGYIIGVPDDPKPAFTADYYFVHGASLTAEHGSDLNRGVRERAASMAEDGPAALLALVDEALDGLRLRLASEPAECRVGVFGIEMVLDEYLVTRLVEFAVHLDDLAVSVDRATPDLSPTATACALGCLFQMARLRHGDLAVLRAMARRERDVVDALRVL